VRQLCGYDANDNSPTTQARDDVDGDISHDNSSDKESLMMDDFVEPVPSLAYARTPRRTCIIAGKHNNAHLLPKSLYMSSSSVWQLVCIFSSKHY
jgi:hypothetical protein